MRHARQAQGSGSAKTFVVSEGLRVAGYFSLTVGQVDSLDAPDRIRKAACQYPIPAVILARLAGEPSGSGPRYRRGHAAGCYSPHLYHCGTSGGIRAMLTHPIDEEAAHFYTRFGLSGRRCVSSSFLLLLKDARAVGFDATTFERVNLPRAKASLLFRIKISN